MASSDLAAALDFLFGRIDYERQAVMPYGALVFKLDRMRELLRRLGNPQDGLVIAHIAGTKGKGSTTAMIAAIATASGRRAGMFTSPHLHQVNERMMIDGVPCPDDDLCRLIQQVQAVAEVMDREPRGDDLPGPTYFELTTAMALLHFAQRGVDLAVLEVGLGGRLDSTNVCQPCVTAITSISFDHTKQLGNTLAEIAREKAGIVKPGIPCVSGVTEDEPRTVIAHICDERGSPLRQLGRDFTVDYHPGDAFREPEVDFFWRGAPPCHRSGVRLGLLGGHQARNAGVALAVVEELARAGYEFSDAAIRRGLAGILWPARVEVVHRRPFVIVDAAHNVASVAALLETLEDNLVPGQRVLVFATTRDKDVRGMLRQLLPRFERVILTRYMHNPRYVPVETLAELAAECGGSSVLVASDPAAAWRMARQGLSADDLVCVTGSFFIAAEMREEIRRDPPA